MIAKEHHGLPVVSRWQSAFQQPQAMKMAGNEMPTIPAEPLLEAG
jgi:hypothetical protein